MGAIAEGIERNIRAKLAPVRFALADESDRHAGHTGWREGGETHFRIEVVSTAFAGLSRVRRQQLVYGLLDAEFAAGLHALSMATLTPEEDAARR